MPVDRCERCFKVCTYLKESYLTEIRNSYKQMLCIDCYELVQPKK